MKIDVAFLPEEIKKADLSATVCIVLDIFRATTSIVTAVANGCKAVIPVLTTADAYKVAVPMKSVLFAGERQSIRIEGFDFGNSPFEFSRDKVKDQTIAMTTTNGTIAIKATEQAYCTLIGSFINAESVCRQAGRHQKDILIVCAGTDQLFSLEDAFCAGLLVNLLQNEEKVMLTDSARGVWEMYKGAKYSIVEVTKHSRNGRRLVEMGCEADIEYCLQASVADIVPRYSEGRIHI